MEIEKCVRKHAYNHYENIGYKNDNTENKNLKKNTKLEENK